MSLAFESQNFFAIERILRANMTNKSEIIDEYTAVLEREIENKRYFLKESHDALRDLIESKAERLNGAGSVQGRRSAINKDVWQKFIEKPMYLPERQDPIGLNLVSARLREKTESMGPWLEVEKEIVHVEETYLNSLRQLNAAMQDTIAEFRKNPPKPREELVSKDYSLSSLKTQHESLHKELKEFVTRYLEPNAPENTSAEEMLQLISTLVQGKTLDKDQFKNSQSLFRLLMKGMLLENTDTDSYKLIDLVS